jgi:Cu/Ag efflux protein CusF
MVPMKRLIQTSLTTLAFAAALLAHGGAEHLAGTVKSIAADSITIETTKHEVVAVALSPKTVAMKGKVKGDLKDLKAGDRVVVHAEKGHDGKYSANEVDYSAEKPQEKAKPSAK